MNSGFADVHHHLLYGLDDGAKNAEETIRMLHEAAGQGVTHIAATPHIQPGHGNFDMELYEKRLEAVRSYIRKQGLNLTVWSGAEIYYTASTVAWLQQGRVPLLGNGWHVLVEFHPDVAFDMLCSATLAIGNAGFGVLLAHAERYRALRRGDHLAQLKEECNVKVQMNSSTVIGSCRPLGDRWVKRVLKQGLVDVIASDAHNTASRACSMAQSARVIRHMLGPEAVRRLFVDNPLSLLNEKEGNGWAGREDGGML